MSAHELKLSLGLTLRGLPDGDAVVAGSDEVDAVIVNSTAHMVLDLLAKGCTRHEIEELFCQSFADQDPVMIRRDIAALFEYLLRAGIVEPCGIEPSTA